MPLLLLATERYRLIAVGLAWKSQRIVTYRFRGTRRSIVVVLMICLRLRDDRRRSVGSINISVNGWFWSFVGGIRPDAISRRKVPFGSHQEFVKLESIFSHGKMNGVRSRFRDVNE